MRYLTLELKASITVPIDDFPEDQDGGVQAVEDAKKEALSIYEDYQDMSQHCGDPMVRISYEADFDRATKHMLHRDIALIEDAPPVESAWSIEEDMEEE